MNESLSPPAPPLTIGILSDTHLTRLTPEFSARVDCCFKGVSIILHAGDLTEPSILQAFASREVHAVHGNMCSHASRRLLPTKKTIQLGHFRDDELAAMLQAFGSCGGGSCGAPETRG